MHLGTGLNLHVGRGPDLNVSMGTGLHASTGPDLHVGTGIEAGGSQSFLNDGRFSSLPSRLSQPPLPSVVIKNAGLSASSIYSVGRAILSQGSDHHISGEKQQRSQEIIEFLSGRKHLMRNPDSIENELQMLTDEFASLTMKHYGHYMAFDVKSDQIQQQIQRKLVSMS